MDVYGKVRNERTVMTAWFHGYVCAPQKKVLYPYIYCRRVSIQKSSHTLYAIYLFLEYAGELRIIVSIEEEKSHT